MPCASVLTSLGNKGVGTRLYMDPDECTQVVDPDADPLEPDGSNDYIEIECTQEVTPPGVERAEEDDDGCLAVDAIITSAGPRKLTSATVSFRYSINGTVEEAIRTTEKSGLPRSFVIKHPVGTTFVYEWFDAIITQFAPQQVTKRGFRTATMRLTPQIDSGYTDDPTDLGTGIAATTTTTA